jgi:hypothetical protein
MEQPGVIFSQFLQIAFNGPVLVPVVAYDCAILIEIVLTLPYTMRPVPQVVAVNIAAEIDNTVFLASLSLNAIKDTQNKFSSSACSHLCQTV